jgi:hypothetical protein
VWWQKRQTEVFSITPKFLMTADYDRHFILSKIRLDYRPLPLAFSGWTQKCHGCKGTHRLLVRRNKAR